MSEGFKTKSEEIEDSLEFCRDIDLYYKGGKNENTPSSPAFSYKPVYASAPDTSGYAPEENYESVTSVIISNIIHLLVCVVIAAIISRGINKYILQQVSVDGSSMEASLYDGDRLLMNKFDYRFNSPKRFDIVIFPFEDDVYLIKRVIGLPGETIQIIDGYVYINGEFLQNDIYCDDTIETAGTAMQPLKLDDDEIFVLGDNRNNSLDSRYTAVGNIKISDIMGKAFYRVYPFERLGKVE